MSASPWVDPRRAPGEAFLDALAARDFDRLESLLSPAVRFRALIPPGVEEEREASRAVGHLRNWFGDAGAFRVVHREVARVADRVRLSYRIRLHTAKGERIVEQHAFLRVTNDEICAVDILCSGFRPDLSDD